MSKQIIILKHGGGELANQLWNYLSIYAFGLEKGIRVRNPSFYEYHFFFRFLERESWVTNVTSRLFFRTPRRRSSLISVNQRFKYAQRAWLTAKFFSSCVYSSENTENRQTYLPPSGELPARYSSCQKLYLAGWLFRNPRGLEKFAKELRQAFMPTDEVSNKVDSLVSPLRQSYKSVIGVHIRQSDYKDFKGGRFAISQERARAAIDEYIREKGLDAASTVFLIASDGKIDGQAFSGLNTYVSRENAVVDLFLLSKADAILGSDSSFGAFAAWHGDIPHIIIEQGQMDWSYYADKKAFFENERSQLMRY